jgi:YidC/Oxa1 family membrane protein insertase
MDRRTLLAIGLMLVVAVLPSILFQREPEGEPEGTVPAVEEQAPAPVPSVEELPESIPSALRAPATPSPEPAGTPGEESIVVSSPLYEYTFSTRGGRLTGALLKTYRSFAVRAVPAERGSGS